jgi:probable F420-dependent oxidoreductase
MKVGVNLINFGPSATPETLRGWAQLAETLGYHFLMTSDHVGVTPDVQARFPAPLYEPLSMLGWLAGVTRNITIGASAIIVPYRSPLEVARAFANIDNLCGGRCILGVGVGWARQEFEALKVPFAKRGAITNEYLAAIKQLWTHEISSFDGEFVRFDDVDSRPLPVQSPHPPIWVGGTSDAALRRAVRYGDAWHPLRITVPWLRHVGLPKLREIAQHENRPVPDPCPRIMLRLTEAQVKDDDRVAGEGTIEQVHQDMRELQALGCTHVLLDTYYDDLAATADYEAAWRMLTEMAEKVLDLDREAVR